MEPHNKGMQSDTLLLAPVAECAADAGRYAQLEKYV